MPNPLKRWIESDRHKLKKIDQIARRVESYAPAYAKLSDHDLQAKTPEFRQRVADGATLDDILPEAFAVCREAAFRVLGMRPYHVQIMGGIILHQGDIAEMRTGEGKTLTATMPVYLNAICHKGVHVITVNEYLSGRDAEEMKPLYNWLGCTVGANNSKKSASEKREAYNCDIMYSTHSEIGFDYLRDNMADYPEDQVQKPFNFALVDEVDSVLIDEAKTPLIVSGNNETPTVLCKEVDRFVKLLKKDVHYKTDAESKTVILTPEGMQQAQNYFNLDNLYSGDNPILSHHIDKALNANYMMERDKDYMVKNGEILIIDSFTGRAMSGRRFSDGLHQALEAKEHVEIKKENKTMASITYQNLFRMYPVLAGMTGTAKTEKEEFREIYRMDVITVPTNRPILRIDEPDAIYPTVNAKFKAVVNKIKDLHAKQQPVLIGTIAVESSEKLSNMLDKAGLDHVTLNAKNDKAEAEIVKKAGHLGAITIATNMASRGTDIKLSKQVKSLGGLAVIGTERAESRRVDDQLRGRAGRQGDPGFSQFYLSLEDDLMLRFGGKLIKSYLDKVAPDQEDLAITSKLMSHQIENAQKQVEGNNYDSRKQTLSYDNILREQREVIYQQRQLVIDEKDNLEDVLKSMIKRTINREVDNCTASEQSTWDYQELLEFGQEIINHEISYGDLQLLSRQQLKEFLLHRANQVYYQKKKAIPTAKQLLELQRVTILKVVDANWAEHIDKMSQFKDSVQMRSYAQINPVIAYQTDSFKMFNQMIATIDYQVTKKFLTAKIITE
jgi:preprotein translocase subunit SecA